MVEVEKRAEGMPSPERVSARAPSGGAAGHQKGRTDCEKKDFDRAGLRHRDDADRRRRGAGREPRRFRPIREQ